MLCPNVAQTKSVKKLIGKNLVTINWGFYVRLGQFNVTLGLGILYLFIFNRKFSPTDFLP